MPAVNLDIYKLVHISVVLSQNLLLVGLCNSPSQGVYINIYNTSNIIIEPIITINFIWNKK